ncbi:hypothetical protein DF185_15845 [Marinifilum breve]|uniref:Uncharacterized protein n=1 Tax=Marinifilum breve TaxID=2184082 RepID=A0A2V3ZUW6_9BACT|nr:hypothetical protein DF185_15845 [Marinifilum breve]
MKMYTGKDLHDITYAQTALEIPVDLLFISVTLTITFLTKEASNITPGIILLLTEILLAFFTVIIWRYSVEKLINNNLIPCGLLGLLNYNLSIWPLIYIIYLNSL